MKEIVALVILVALTTVTFFAILWNLMPYVYVTPEKEYYLKTHFEWYELCQPKPVEFYKPFEED